MNACDIPNEALKALSDGFMGIEAKRLGILREQITPEFIAGMRRRMQPYLRHFPESLTYAQRLIWDDMCRRWAQEVLAELARATQSPCASCMLPITR